MLRLFATLIRAWRTLEPAAWSQFAEAWCNATRFAENYVLRWTLAGRILKAAERYEEARDAFMRATELDSKRAKAFIGLGQSLKALGHREAAVAAFAKAYRLGARKSAASQLCRYGARDFLPSSNIDGVAPLHAYAEFIRQHPVSAPPPLRVEAPAFDIQIDARECTPDGLARTLDSLLAQSHGNWRGQILSDATGLSKELPDPRLRRVPPSSTIEPLCDGHWLLRLSAGSVLDPQALSWCAWLIGRSDCDLVYFDHDHYSHENGNKVRCMPVFHPMPDPIWFTHSGAPGLFVTRGGDETPLKACGRSIGHLPRILASIPFPQEEPIPTKRPVAQVRGEGRIAVVIPTRDNPDLLERCVRSLRKFATKPERLQFRIIDNRSVEPATQALFARFLDETDMVLIPFDEPFNWSRANNLGARDVDRDHLLFLNDDTEMLSSGWDDLLTGTLEKDQDAGVIGARLLYPNRAVQHAGFVFGMDNGPQHEARWMPDNDPGPQGRWVKPHCAVAVTGAFMGIRAAVFNDMGRFDDRRFAIDFSDLDICLRARAAGHRVIYEPRIEMIHHESVSRGHNRSRRKRQRARDEFNALNEKWGRFVYTDPGYNPHWTRDGCSFDGYREPALHEIVEHALQSTSPDPWRVVQNSASRP